MTAYLEILGPRPFENGVDDNDRIQFTMNFEAKAEGPVGQWAYDLQKILADVTPTALSQITTTPDPPGRDTWIGPEATLGTGDGPYIRIVETGSVLSEESHNSASSEVEMLSAQITVSAQSRSAAETRALAVWRAINQTRSETVTP